MIYYLKLDKDGSTILGHDYKLNGPYNTQVSFSDKLIHDQGSDFHSFYKYKYEGGALTPLSLEEINSEIAKKKSEYCIENKIKKLEYIYTRVFALEKIIASETLTENEINYINKKISSLISSKPK
jgi:hypothetical protein